MQGCPPVDLLIRTSGESRLSDFMLWQATNAQLVFADVLWPDFTFWDLLRALINFQRGRSQQCRLRQACLGCSQRHSALYYKND